MTGEISIFGEIKNESIHGITNWKNCPRYWSFQGNW